ncbi:MAG: DeoR/GlpR family DNA-binding transcription regulator [Spirochaetota bacterium]
MGKIDSRKSEIMKMLSVYRNLNVDAIVRELGVSDATIRRTLNALEQEGKIIRTHGGARLAPQFAPEYSFLKQAAINIKQKEMIGRCAASIVEQRDILFLDSGTTVLSVAKVLARRIESKEITDLSIVTNSIIVGEVLGNLCKVFLLGGEVRLSRKDISGPIAEKFIRMFRANRAFIGADALSINDGLMTTDTYTSRIEEEMIKRSDQVVLVVDSSKFNKYSMVSFARLTDIDLIITDNQLSEEIKREYEEHGTRILIAENNAS